MDEARRLIRYVVPGSLFALEFALFFSLMLPQKATDIGLALMAKDAGFAIAISALLASGVLGFLFSTIHHWFHWHSWQWLHPGCDYSKIVGKIDSGGVKSAASVKDTPGLNSLQGDWVIVNAFWHTQLRHGRGISAANPRAETMANLVHAVGAATAATVCSFPAALVGSYIADPIKHKFCGIATILWVLLVVVHEWSYRDTIRISQSFVAEVVARAVSSED